MKKQRFLAIMMLLLVALLLVACGGDDKDKVTAPAEITWSSADWDIIIGEADFDEKTNRAVYVLSAFWMGDMSGVGLNDTASMIIAGQTVTMSSWFGMPGFFIGSVELTAGQTYNMKFIYNGNEKASTDLQLVHKCSGSFPTSYNPATATSFNWVLSSNNQYQYAGVSSSNMMNEEQYDDDAKFIGPALRTHTVKANAVDSYGAYTEYSLFVGQMNRKVQSRIGFTSIHESSAYYGSMKENADKDPMQMILRAKSIISRNRAAL